VAGDLERRVHRAFDAAADLSLEHHEGVLMPGALPEYVAGAVDYRDAAGAPINPPNVQNAYSPAPAFLSSCLLTALPSDCTARIEARQVNAIVSELLAFAECMDPNGTWDCTSLKNLCTAFTNWVSINIDGIVTIADTPPPNPIHESLWWESDTGYLFIYFIDATGPPGQWVQVVGNNIVVDKVSIVGNGDVVNPYEVGLVDAGVY
jgi:hypothetical protein